MQMQQSLAHIALVVKDYDETIEFYTKKLHFILIEDTVLTETKRWVIIAPKGSTGCNLLLAKAVNKQQEERIGDQTGGRVFLFLYTDNIKRDHNSLIENGISIVKAPVMEEYGTVLVFSDLYGNLWDLIEPKSV
jgi:catechol 2,3-dioxygenase-like lactoylglutathione lyase family enzyme